MLFRDSLQQSHEMRRKLRLAWLLLRIILVHHALMMLCKLADTIHGRRGHGLLLSIGLWCAGGTLARWSDRSIQHRHSWRFDLSSGVAAERVRCMESTWLSLQL